MEEETVVGMVREVLVGVARAGGTITYEDLVGRLDESVRDELRGEMAAVLRRISIAAEDEGLGLLTAIVVRDDTARPGNGWFALAAERGRDVSDRDRMWQEEIELVHRSAQEA